MNITNEELAKVLEIAENTGNEELKDILGVVIMFSQDKEMLEELAVQSLVMLNDDIATQIDLDTLNYH